MSDWWTCIDQDDAWQQMNENEYRRHLEELDDAWQHVNEKEPSSWILISEWLKEKVSDRNNRIDK